MGIDSRWIQTFTGKQFNPLYPKAEDICIEDIAHSLALTCRFRGHSEEFYSVAQHSVFVSNLVEVEYKKRALLHDAAKAYLCDLPKPIKCEFKTLIDSEKYLQALIEEKFGLEVATKKEIEIIHNADRVALATEMRDLMKPPPFPWQDLPKPDTDIIIPIPWEEAETLYYEVCRFILNM